MTTSSTENQIKYFLLNNLLKKKLSKIKKMKNSYFLKKDHTIKILSHKIDPKKEVSEIMK